MDSFSSKILEKIKQEKVTPKSRSYFVCLNILLILAIIISIVIGSLATAIVIRHFSLTDWELAHQFSGGNIKAFFILLPYLWFVFILFAIFFADQLFRQTKTGYRRKSWVILLISILLSLNFGYILYLAKLDKPFEDILISNIPFYKNLEKHRNQLFAAPDMGVLAGQIIAINSEEEWILMDFADNKWFVSVDKAKIKNNFIPLEGINVGMLGAPIDENHFEAKMITLWKKQILLPTPPTFFELKIDNVILK